MAPTAGIEELLAAVKWALESQFDVKAGFEGFEKAMDNLDAVYWKIMDSRCEKTMPKSQRAMQEPKIEGGGMSEALAAAKAARGASK
jgi:hypothetical protein